MTAAVFDVGEEPVDEGNIGLSDLDHADGRMADEIQTQAEAEFPPLEVCAPGCSHGWTRDGPSSRR
ncbi:hypothetical protein QI633_25090 [Nocardioides sp. QY071]|uniref:hypothetical protein n=1 Tax=Nocardioides sp. QY071 TaxID=3044187 RepID=UPI00249A9B81|nr:hypothetical protein [Nocardioides sp. QY071]WGY01797.1 hypothetical protein QI633_25090 [Nocardioides sp. QY071]